QLPDPPPARRKPRLTHGARQMALYLLLVQLSVIEAAERSRQATERPDETEMRGGVGVGPPDPGVLRKLQAELGFALYLLQRISRGKQIGDEEGRTVCSPSEIADLASNREGAMHRIPAGAEVLRPGKDQTSEETVRSGL